MSGWDAATSTLALLLPALYPIQASDTVVIRPGCKAAPGDILLMRFTRYPQHLAIVGDRGAPFSLIHACANAGACVGHGADARWLWRIVAADSFKQPHSDPWPSLDRGWHAVVAEPLARLLPAQRTRSRIRTISS